MTDDLIEFLRARLAEDEQTADAARCNGHGRWTTDTYQGESAGIRDRSIAITVAYDNYGVPRPSQRTHIARHDPARVLRDVEAKRRIVDGAESANRLVDATEYPDGYDVGRKTAWGDTLKLLALPYADHPDYNPEWAGTP